MLNQRPSNHTVMAGRIHREMSNTMYKKLKQKKKKKRNVEEFSSRACCLLLLGNESFQNKGSDNLMEKLDLFPQITFKKEIKSTVVQYEWL